MMADFRWPICGREPTENLCFAVGRCCGSDPWPLTATKLPTQRNARKQTTRRKNGNANQQHAAADARTCPTKVSDGLRHSLHRLRQPALLCSPFHAFSLSAPNNPVLTIPGFKAFALVGVVISLVCSVFQIAAGIGLLKLKRWARQGAVMYAIFALTYALISLPAIVLMLVPHLSTAHDPVMQAGLIGGLIGGVIGGVIGMIFPICLLIFMRKPRAVAACCK